MDIPREQRNEDEGEEEAGGLFFEVRRSCAVLIQLKFIKARR